MKNLQRTVQTMTNVERIAYKEGGVLVDFEANTTRHPLIESATPIFINSIFGYF